MPTRAVPAQPPAGAPGAENLVWLDALKGVAMLWIVLNHVVERLWGSEFAGNPTGAWPPLAARIAQFATPLGSGVAALAATAVRDVGWVGDQGVTLFLIASGFGLAASSSRRGVERVAPGPFFRARAARIYPLWLGAHAVLLVGALLAFAKLGPSFVLSAAGIRFLPQTMYAFVPAWWYVGLLLQLYAVVPLLWAALRRFGPWPVLAAACALGFAARALGFVAFDGYLDAWERGAIFITRLPEFAFGMCLGAGFAGRAVAEGRHAVPRARVALAVAGFAFALGFACAFTRAGIVVSPFLMGGGAFVLLARALDGERPGLLAWTGRNSYALYLVHQPFVTALVPAAGGVSALAAALRIGAALALTVAGARALELVVAAALAGGRALRGRGFVGAAALLGLGAVVAYGLLLAADRAAAALSPQEIYGWGERPSLEPDPAFGWKMIPNVTTRLRWTSYDYVVRANALGFPGHDVAPQKPPGTLRVLVTGDAFTSGEGVGTDAAWPQLLERDLARREGRTVQVLDFGITGYGPDQEARVLRAFVPRFRPDVVVLESFVNAFEKLGQSDDEIRASIGFGRPPGDGLAATLRLYHLRAFLIEGVARPLRERLTGVPSAADAGFSDAEAFERDDPGLAAEVAAYRARVRAARDVARAAHAAFLLVMIPSRSQVCSAADFPRGAFLSLADDARYDAQRPQRDAAATARALGVPFLDLRRALAAGPCPYQKFNMHFVSAGDERTAAAVAAAIARPAP